MILWISTVSAVMSPFSFLILLIWVFSLCHLISLARGLSILLIFSKNQLFVSLILWIVFCVSILLISALSLIISSLYSWVSLLLFFSRAFRCAVKSLMCAFSIFLMRALSAMNFPLSTAFIVSHRFGYDVSLFSLNSRKTDGACDQIGLSECGWWWRLTEKPRTMALGFDFTARMGFVGSLSVWMLTFLDLGGTGRTLDFPIG